MLQSLSQGEKYSKVLDIWGRANDLVSKAMMEGISTEPVTNKDGEEESQSSLTPYSCMPILVLEDLQLRSVS